MTDLDLRAGQIHRGLGIVARWPDVALVIPSESSHDANVDQMFNDLGSDPEAAALVEAVERLLNEKRLHSIGMLVEATGGPMATVQGAVEILVDGVAMLDGAGGPVREQVAASAGRLTIRAANLVKAAEPVPPYDLRRGIAPGAGLTLLRVAAARPPSPANFDPPTPPASPPPPEVRRVRPPVPAQSVEPPVEQPQSEQPTPKPAPRSPSTVEPAPPGVRSGRFDRSDERISAPVRPPVPQSPAVPGSGPSPSIASSGGPGPIAVPFRSVLLLGRNAPGDASPLPLAAATDTGELTRGELDAGRAQVDGILCSREHFNNPGAAYCMVCGISMLHLTHNLVRGPRPTLGFIVFDDGSTFGLDRSYAIGREPSLQPGSEAELLVLHDNNETLSRTHAELRLDAWAVRLVDLESTNGTYIWDRSFERWNQLAPGHPMELGSGDTVALGRRTFVFESVSRGG